MTGQSEKRPVPDENGEICTGQCGYQPFCRDCMKEKERLEKERLNPMPLPDDN